MQDSYNREINYMRVSITDRCNLRCVYCMPEEGVKKISHDGILRYEEIRDIVKEASKLGINKIRITGGEPLVRKDVHKLIYLIKDIEKIKTISLSTNGTLIAPIALTLKNAGLNSVNISLDTLNEKRYKTLTRGGDIKEVFNGIEKSIESGLKVKLNVVIYDDISKKELPEIYEYAKQKNIEVQTIERYNLNKLKKDSFQYDRPPKCEYCNKIRLLSNGYLLSCLHSDEKIKVDLNDIKSSLVKAIETKPKCGLYGFTESVNEIGG